MNVQVHYSVLFILGASAFAGILGSWLFQKMRVPQVVGYVVVGLLIGKTGIGLIDAEHISALRPFTKFALGVIGFLVGGELHLSEFRKHGRQFAAIVMGEGLLSFLLVGLSTGLIVYFLSGNTMAALAGGLVLGAISSATDPASTIGVLWETRSRGALTSSIIAVVAMDDALAMSLYGFGRGLATILAGGEASVWVELAIVAKELGGALVLGLLMGLVLNFFLRRLHDRDKSLSIALGCLMLVIGVSAVAGLDVILASMTLGFAVANLAPRRGRELFVLMRSMSIPIYVLFFVLVGARLDFGGMSVGLWCAVGCYVVFRSTGKVLGAWMGARLSGASDEVRRYCGPGLFAQGGVAVGLSIVAGDSLSGIELTEGVSLGAGVVACVTATTLILQVLGPAMTKMAVKAAGEAGRDITEEDVLKTMTVADAMSRGARAIPEHCNINEVLRTFAESDSAIHPVADKNGNLAGIISFGLLRQTLPEQDTWAWLLASDIMCPAEDVVRPEMPLSEALDMMRDTELDDVLVVDSAGSRMPLGVLERARVRKAVRKEYLRRTRGDTA